MRDDESFLIGVVHTAPALCAEIDRLVDQEAAGIRLMHLVDEGLLATAIREGTSRHLIERLSTQLGFVVESGARAVLVSCSSLGLAVETLRPASPVPLLRIDEPMAGEAVRLGARVGILATIASTLEPTEDVLRRSATSALQEVVIVSKLCDGAFEAWRRGDVVEHDRQVHEGLADLAAEVDVVVLAQASMRRALGAPGAPKLSVPVLSSPASGVHQLSALAHSIRKPAETRVDAVEARPTDGAPR